MYKVLFYKEALKDYQKQDVKKRKRIDRAIETIISNPCHGTNIKKLTGELSNLYRYRLGGFRILYEIHKELEVVRIKAIESRGDIYKR